MRKFQIYSILIVISLLFPNFANARRRRHRRHRRSRHKKIKLYSIKGRVLVSRVKPKGWQNLLRSIEIFHSKANWKFRDPLVIQRSKPSYSGKIIIAIFNVKLPEKLKNYKPKYSSTMLIKGMGFTPTVIPLYFEDDFHIKNSDAIDLKVYSPGRIINGKPFEPQTIAKEDNRVFPIYPRDTDPDFSKKSFWYYPLAITNYPFAKGGVIFLKTKFFTVLNDDGSFKLPKLPVGSYVLKFIYFNKLLVEKKVEITKKGRMKPISVKLTLPFLKYAF